MSTVTELSRLLIRRIRSTGNTPELVRRLEQRVDEIDDMIAIG